MRSALIAFGIVLGLVVMIVAARYGWEGADSRIDAALSALWNAGLAAGGLFGFAVAARVARAKWRLAGALAALCSTIFLVFNLSNTLGFWVERGAVQDAALRLQATVLAADQSSLAQKQSERAALMFEPTSETAAALALRAAQAARSSADAECGVITRRDGSQIYDPDAKRGAGRGGNYRRLEGAAAQTEAEAARLATEKAKTDSAADLDAGIVALKAKLAGSRSSSAGANGQGVAIARLLASAIGVEFNAVTAAVWQKFGMSAAVELLILMSLLSAEWIRSERATGQDALTGAPVSAGRAPMEPLADQATAQVARRIFGEVFEPAPGARLALDDVAKAFALTCIQRKLRPMDPTTFSRELAKFCREQHLEVATDGAQPEIVGVRISASEIVKLEAEKT